MDNLKANYVAGLEKQPHMSTGSPAEPALQLVANGIPTALERPVLGLSGFRSVLLRIGIP